MIAAIAQPKRAGLSMVEVVVSTVLVGMIVAASIQTVASAVAVRTRTKTLSVGPALAAELLHEVLTTQYEDEDSPNTAPGPEVGETGTNRTGFDDIDDFHGWSSPSAVQADGTPIRMESPSHC